VAEHSAKDVTTALLFAPKDCTGNSGAIGDTILQTSLLRTLIDRSVFPNLEEIHWWGTKGVIEELFPSLCGVVQVHDWTGAPDDLQSNPDGASHYHRLREAVGTEAAVFICTRNEDVITKLRKDFGHSPCCEPATPLDAQSPVHLSRQLHSCLDVFGIYVTHLPEPRIEVTQADIDAVRHAMNQLRTESDHAVEGKHTFKLGVDRVFLLQPGLKANVHDRRTWNSDKWKELVRILGEVGVVIVACDKRETPDAKAEQLAAYGIAVADGVQTYNWRFDKRLSPRELAAWACASSVCVVRDSGPMHVCAAAIGPKERARVLGLFSVMCPDTWRPLSASFKGLGQWPLPLEPYVTPDRVAVEATHW
jgi:glycosyl transferase family 9 (putative heptosyltransferase)